jgi:hypothetical protein
VFEFQPKDGDDMEVCQLLSVTIVSCAFTTIDKITKEKSRIIFFIIVFLLQKKEKLLGKGVLILNNGKNIFF